MARTAGRGDSEHHLNGDAERPMQESWHYAVTLVGPHQVQSPSFVVWGKSGARVARPLSRVVQ